MMFTATESGMTFGPFPEERVFPIEALELHKKAGKSIRCVEFLYLQPEQKLLFIEAKSSSPRSETHAERFEEFICEITEKFLHSFDLYAASKLGRYSELGGELAKCSDADIRYKFVLIINGHREEWLLPLQDELRKRLNWHSRIWGTTVNVLNEAIAEEEKLISAFVPKQPTLGGTHHAQN